METKTPYQRKLAHPDWQRKRLEVMQRDGFKCTHCLAKDQELHVHHIYYLNKSTLPQDYPMGALTTLCHECHEIEEQRLDELKHDLPLMLRQKGAQAEDIDTLFHAIFKSEHTVKELANALYFYNSINKEERDFIQDSQKEDF